MNETKYILFGVFAFLLGWFIAYFVKNFGQIWARWGAIVGFIITCMVFVYTLIFTAMIADSGDVIISALLAVGFLVRFFKQRQEG